MLFTVFKKILIYNYESISRLFLRHYLSLKFIILYKSTIRKALHIKGQKFFKIGRDVSIDSNARIDVYKTKDVIPQLKIANNVMISFNFTALVTTSLVIDENVLIASNVFITTENHGINPELGPYINQQLVSGDVHIKRNVWIGEKVIILPGVTVGEYSIIGAGSIVTKNIPPYSIACGNPAKVIKKYDLDKHSWAKVD